MRRTTEAFYVTVEWPDSRQPWTVLIDATSKREAQRTVERSDDVKLGRGRVVEVLTGAEVDALLEGKA